MICISLGMWALFYWVGSVCLVAYHFYMMYILYEGYLEKEMQSNKSKLDEYHQAKMGIALSQMKTSDSGYTALSLDAEANKLV